MTRPGPTEPVRVLIVEDDDAVADLHVRYLADLPRFEVVGRTTSVAESLAWLEHRHADLVLLDMYLADGSGLSVLRRLRAVAADGVDVIMVTSASERPVVERSLGFGVADYLLKPFSPHEFGRRLAAYDRARTARMLAPSARPLTQADIDLLRDPGSAVRTLPKGLAAATSDRVATTLRDAAGPLTASDVADRVGVSRVSARRYLEHLAATGRAHSQPRYGEPGRPTTEYTWIG